jgi:hypothetical protein
MLGAVVVIPKLSVSFASHEVMIIISGGVEPPLTRNVVHGCMYNGV